jgi:hypothetical protein
MLTQELGDNVYVVPKATYTTVGQVVTFTSPTTYIAIKVHVGTALIALNGNPSGPFLEIGPGEGFSYSAATTALYVKGSGASADVSIVSSLSPLED